MVRKVRCEVVFSLNCGGSDKEDDISVNDSGVVQENGKQEVIIK